MKKTVTIIIGTRPEALKLLPLFLAIKSSKSLVPILISTGQHREMVHQVFKFFKVKPDYDLDLMSENQTLAGLTSKIFSELDQLLARLNPDLVVVQGDTTTTWVAAMLGFFRGIKVAHIEAGLRSNDRSNPFPEEVNRRMVSLVSDINFTPTTKSTEHLKKEGFSNIFQVGNTIVDALEFAKEIVTQERAKYKAKFEGIFQRGKKIVLITCHRRENIASIQYVIKALRLIAMRHQHIHFVFPVHPSPNIKSAVEKGLGQIQNIFLLSPLPYDELIFLLSEAYLVLTDSGGIQEEAPSFGVPLLILRKVTERSEAVESGYALIAGVTTNSIVDTFNQVVEHPKVYENLVAQSNPFGDGKASKRILEVLENQF